MQRLSGLAFIAATLAVSCGSHNEGSYTSTVNETFGDCIARRVSSRNGLSLEDRRAFSDRLALVVDLNLLARQIGEHYTSQQLARDTEVCLRKPSPSNARLELSEVDQRSGLSVNWKTSASCGLFAGTPCEFAVGALLDRSLVLSKYDSTGSLSQQPVGVRELYDLTLEKAPAEAVSIKFHVTRSSNDASEPWKPVAGAVVRLRALTASRILGREGCSREGEPPTVEQLWDGVEDPCLEARTNANGEVTFVHDATIVGYKLSITTASEAGAEREGWIHSAEPGIRIPAVVQIRLKDDHDNLAAWEQAAAPGCGDAAKWAKLLQMEEADGTSQENASVWVDQNGHLSEPFSVPPEIWRRVRHVRIATHGPCKPRRLNAL